MSVPGTFTDKQIAEGRLFLIAHLRLCKLIKDKIKGQPLITYSDLANHMGWTIETRDDGQNNMGAFAGAISHLEMDQYKGPMLSACIVRKESNGYPGTPGKGFFQFGMDVGKMASIENIEPDGLKEMAFWSSEVKACVAKYGS